jgi:hypothetical protein
MDNEIAVWGMSETIHKLVLYSRCVQCRRRCPRTRVHAEGPVASYKAQMIYSQDLLGSAAASAHRRRRRTPFVRMSAMRCDAMRCDAMQCSLSGDGCVPKGSTRTVLWKEQPHANRGPAKPSLVGGLAQDARGGRPTEGWKPATTVPHASTSSTARSALSQGPQPGARGRGACSPSISFFAHRPC